MVYHPASPGGSKYRGDCYDFPPGACSCCGVSFQFALCKAQSDWLLVVDRMRCIDWLDLDLL